MLSHVSIGVKDLAKARGFYDAALKELGYKCLMDGDGYAYYGTNGPEFGIMAVKHPVPANPESGLHICFDGAKRADVDAFHAAALKAGGTSDGAPGLRPEYYAGYYAAFIRDPDGNRIEAVTFLGEPG